MKVLWFTILPLEAVNRRFNRPTQGSGFWMNSLVDPLVQAGVELAVVTATAGDPACRFQDGGVEYFNIPQFKLFEVHELFRRRRLNSYLRQAGDIVEAWKPDLIHVHGTERFFGLVRARGLTSVPTIVSVQGLIEQCAPFMAGALSRSELRSTVTLHDLLRNHTIAAAARRMRRNIELEREILRGADAILGRTDWDRAHTRRWNPDAPYYHVDEMLRPEFRSAEPWSLSTATRRTLITTSSAFPHKGLAVLLEATALLRRWGHDVRLKVAGVSPDGMNRAGATRHIRCRIDRLGIADVVELLGWTNAEGLIRHIRGAHCFVTSSYIENSSNAIGEAQLLGIPCVSTHVGGTPTLIRDGETGLMFDRGDSAMLALQIERILREDDLARNLGAAGREAARRRHDPDRILRDLLNSYEQTVGERRTAPVPE